jgi:hypothetical protein
VPIVLETSLQAQIVIPMAASLAFGILFSTVITLFMIPALYLVLDDFRNWWREAIAHLLPGRKPARRAHAHPAVAEPRGATSQERTGP